MASWWFFCGFWSQLGLQEGAPEITLRGFWGLLGPSWGQDSTSWPPDPSKRGFGSHFGRFLIEFSSIFWSCGAQFWYFFPNLFIVCLLGWLTVCLVDCLIVCLYPQPRHGGGRPEGQLDIYVCIYIYIYTYIYICMYMTNMSIYGHIWQYTGYRLPKFIQ